MNPATKPAGEKTKELILSTALDLFRKSGFETATMRDIASSADVALGAAYYYFPSKEAIVSAYYDQVQRIHAEKTRDEWKGKSGLRERLGGMILFFMYDETKGQQRTHKLIDGVLDLLTQAIELTNSALIRPFVQPFQTKMLEILREAGW